MDLKTVGSSLGVLWGALEGALVGSLVPLDRSKTVSKFVLESSWASFARFLLPIMASGEFYHSSEPLGLDFELPS